MSTFVPFLEHRREAAFAPTLSPWSMSSVMTPAPTRTPEEEAEGSHSREEEEEQDQEAEETEAKSPGTMERHSIPIAKVSRPTYREMAILDG